MNIEFDFGGITAFHNGLFAAFYIGAAIVIWIYYGHIRGDRALSLQSMAMAFIQLFSYAVGVIDPTNLHLRLALAGFCCCSSPTIMLCVREAIEPGWISWRRYFEFVGPFLVAAVLMGIFAQEYLFYITIVCNLWFCSYAAYKLIKGINRHEVLIKQYFADTEDYSCNWVRIFVYLQVVNVLFLFYLYENLNVTLNILFNYFQVIYWVYFLLMCKKYRYYSRQIPKEIQEDITKLEEVESEKDAKNSLEIAIEKSMISSDTFDYIEKRLEELEEDGEFLKVTLNLASLAQIVGTNRTYMSVFFRVKETTFWDFINEKRCKYAVKIMKEHPNLSMAAIANSAGYKTENCFRSSFQTIYGKTPFVYKREMRLRT